MRGATGTEPRTVRRTQAQRSEDMRQRLIEATLDCLAQEGYAGLTISKITERAGVSRGAPTHHFLTKGALIEAAARELVARLSRKLVDASEASKGAPDPFEAFAIAVWEKVFMAQEGVLLSEFTYASRREPELEAIISRLWTQMHQLTGRVAAHYVTSNQPEVSAKQVVLLTQWLMRGMAQDVHLGAPPEMFQSYLKVWRWVLEDVVETGNGDVPILTPANANGDPESAAGPQAEHAECQGKSAVAVRR